MGRPSGLNCGFPASRHRALRRSDAKAYLLEINSDSTGDISTKCLDTDPLESHSAFTALASVCVYHRFHLRRRAVFHCVVAKSKELFA